MSTGEREAKSVAPEAATLEQEAVRTTIVGGRPPGSGQSVGAIPRGIEVLVKKAAVDPEFKRLLIANRDQAAAEIGLHLEPAESLMLQAVPADQLTAIIDGTSVPQEHRRVFLGKAAAAMLAALGISQSACGPKEPPLSDGIRPDRPVKPPGTTTGIQPDMPELPSDPEPPGETTGDAPPDSPQEQTPDQTGDGPPREQFPAPTGISPDFPDG